MNEKPKYIMSIGEIKWEARKSLRGHMKTMCLVSLIYFLITLGSVLLTAFFGFGLIVDLVVGAPLGLGLCICVMKLIRAQNVKVGTLYEGVGYMSRVIGLTFVNSLFIELHLLLFIIPGIIKSYAYSMSLYVLADNPKMSQSEIREESMSLMEGNKWRLFFLRLSFIGWILLGLLTCGVLLIWVIPYANAAEAIFYENIKTKKPVSFEENEQKAAISEENSQKV